MSGCRRLGRAGLRDADRARKRAIGAAFCSLLPDWTFAPWMCLGACDASVSLLYGVRRVGVENIDPPPHS